MKIITIDKRPERLEKPLRDFIRYISETMQIIEGSFVAMPSSISTVIRASGKKVYGSIKFNLNYPYS